MPDDNKFTLRCRTVAADRFRTLNYVRAIAATWASVWVRAFLAYGISRSIAHRSTLSAGHGR